jgi:hypothetical protein
MAQGNTAQCRPVNGCASSGTPPLSPWAKAPPSSTLASSNVASEPPASWMTSRSSSSTLLLHPARPAAAASATARLAPVIVRVKVLRLPNKKAPLKERRALAAVASLLSERRASRQDEPDEAAREKPLTARKWPTTRGILLTTRRWRNWQTH